LDPGEVRRLRRRIQKDREAGQGAAKAEPRKQEEETVRLAAAPKSGASQGAGKSREPNVTAPAETQAAAQVARAYANKLAAETNKRIDEATGLGEYVRDWYIGKAIDQMRTDGMATWTNSAEWLAHVTDFWWNNRASTSDLKNRIWDLEDEVEALKAALDPELEYRRSIEEIKVIAAQLSILKRDVPPGLLESMMAEAVRHRKAPHYPIDYVKVHAQTPVEVAGK
jgi:hypothetical protein